MLPVFGNSFKLSIWMFNCGDPLYENTIINEKTLDELSQQIYCLDSWNIDEIFLCIKSLQGFQDTKGVKKVIASLTGQLKKSSSTHCGTKASETLLDLCRIPTKSTEVKALFKELTKIIYNSKDVLSFNVFENLTKSLNNLDLESREIRNFLIVLNQKLVQSLSKFRIHQTLSVLFKLKSLNKIISDPVEIKNLINALAEKINQYDIELDTYEISMSLYNLCDIRSNLDVVKALLKVLGDKIRQSKAILDAESIGKCLYGLKNMSSDSERVKTLLKVLTDKIIESKAQLDAQSISMCLYGLQNMSSDSKRVETLLEVLTDKIIESRALLSTRNIGMCLYGISNMNIESKSVSSLLIILSKKFPKNFSYIDNPLSWLQTVASCLQLGKNKVLPQDLMVQLNSMFSDSIPSSKFNLKVVKKLFIEQLKQDHFQNGILDLHGVDYNSARLILNHVFKKMSGELEKIIYGRSLHRQTNKGKMRRIVEQLLVENHFEGEFALGFVRITHKKPSRYQPAFFSTKTQGSDCLSNNDLQPIENNNELKEFFSIQKKRLTSEQYADLLVGHYDDKTMLMHWIIKSKNIRMINTYFDELNRAIQNRSLRSEYFEYLLQKPDSQGVTPLEQAITTGQLEIVKYFIELIKNKLSAKFYAKMLADISDETIAIRLPKEEKAGLVIDYLERLRHDSLSNKNRVKRLFSYPLENAASSRDQKYSKNSHGDSIGLP